MDKEQATELVKNLLDAAYAVGYNDACGEITRAEVARQKQIDFRKRVIKALVPTSISQIAGTVDGVMIGVVTDRIG